MNDLGVIDQFVNTFSRYIDSGFGLLGPEVSFLTATLVGIDITLAGLFWALGGENVIEKLIKKTLYVGAFAFILSSWKTLSGIILRSFAGLGLTASGASMSAADLLRPGQLAAVGVNAARPILKQVGQLTGITDIFSNLDTVVVLLLAWLVVIVCFFVLAVQIFVTLIEFKLTSLAGFVLVPFALWNKTAFLAERVLGNVISSGIKILVLAVIVGIGSGIFSQFQIPAGTTITIDNALAIMLASLALFGLGLFGPSIASGLVSGAPQLGAGAAAGTALAAGGLGMAGGAAVGGAARLAGSVGGAALRASGPAAMGAYTAFQQGAAASGATGARAAAAGVANVARAGAQAAGQGVQNLQARAGQAIRQRLGLAQSAAPGNSRGEAPAWAQRMQQRQTMSHGLGAAAHTARSGDHGGSGASPSLNQDD
jgi:type IV secretion system protein TrbL